MAAAGGGLAAPPQALGADPLRQALLEPRVGRPLQQYAQAPFLPPSPTNGYTGQPAAVGDTSVLYDLHHNASLSLLGPSSAPLPEHVCLSLTRPASNTYVNAMLSGMALRHPRLLAALFASPGHNRTDGLYDVTLQHAGLPIRVRVDSQFYRAWDAPDAIFEGNAYAINLGHRAYWPAVAEKAFIKLINTYPQAYLPNTERIGFYRGSFSGYAAASLVAAHKAIATLAPGPVFRFNLGQTGPVEFAAVMADLYAGNAVGVFALLRDAAYVHAPGYDADLRTATYGIAFPSGNSCRLERWSGLDYHFDPQCKTGQGQSFGLRSRYGYMVYAHPGANSTLLLRDADHGPVLGDPTADPFTVATSGKIFALPLDLARDLNATLFVTLLSPAAAALDAMPSVSQAVKSPEREAQLDSTPAPRTAPVPGTSPSGTSPSVPDTSPSPAVPSQGAPRRAPQAATLVAAASGALWFLSGRRPATA